METMIKHEKYNSVVDDIYDNYLIFIDKETL